MHSIQYSINTVLVKKIASLLKNFVYLNLGREYSCGSSDKIQNELKQVEKFFFKFEVIMIFSAFLIVNDDIRQDIQLSGE